MSKELPPCGLYKTTEPIGSVPADRLVYFHNHGEPGPGVYVPESWQTNRAAFAKSGIPLEALEQAESLEPLAPEGLYQVTEEFTCCDKNCRTFPPGLLVQLGYNGAGEAILFVPHWHADGLHFPERGFPLDPGRVDKLSRLMIDRPAPKPEVDTEALN